MNSICHREKVIKACNSSPYICNIFSLNILICLLSGITITKLIKIYRDRFNEDICFNENFK